MCTQTHTPHSDTNNRKGVFSNFLPLTGNNILQWVFFLIGLFFIGFPVFFHNSIPETRVDVMNHWLLGVEEHKDYFNSSDVFSSETFCPVFTLFCYLFTYLYFVKGYRDD